MPDLKSLAALGIDTAAGLTYCADDPEFYEEMLMEFADEADKRAVMLDQSYTDRDWAGYRIHAHTLKSASRMIGALAFSERAEEMETAAKEGLTERIDSSHAAFTSELTSLAMSVRDSIGQN